VKKLENNWFWERSFFGFLLLFGFSLLVTTTEEERSAARREKFPPFWAWDRQEISMGRLIFINGFNGVSCG